MATPDHRRRRQAAVLALLLARLARSPELARLLLLIVIWGHVRSRPRYAIVEPPSGPKAKRRSPAPTGRGFSVKRPRERFL
jgi:hypothetical protein